VAMLAGLLYGRQVFVFTSWENLKQRVSVALTRPFVFTDYLSALLTVQFSSYGCCYSSFSAGLNVIQIEFRSCIHHAVMYCTHPASTIVLAEQNCTIPKLTNAVRSTRTVP